MKNNILISATTAIMLFASGCTSVHSQSANDGYVPWWVTDGVPNADGTVITR